MKTQERIELKHLAPYLPYKLKMLHYDKKKVLNAGQGSSVHWVGITHALNHQENIKPLLHPLSRLTEENFWKPLLQLLIDRGIYKKQWADGHDNYDARIIEKPFGKIFKLQNHDDWVLILSFNEIDRCKTIVFNWLVENHFDVFGLIDKGLAEPIELNDKD